MTRSASLLALVVTALLAAAPSAGAAPARLSGVLADDLAPPLTGWTASDDPPMRAILSRPKRRLAFMRGDALALGPGGSIRRALPRRPWSLSLDVRLLAGSAIEIGLGGEPLVLRRLRDGRLRVSSGGRSATLGRLPGWGLRGWRHIEVAGFDPAEVHVDGSRVPHGVVPGGAIRLRVLRGTAHLTGLVVTPRDDPRAILLHRLAALNVRTPARRFPFGTGAGDGVLRFRDGWAAGHWAGSLWRARDLTGGDLFRKWGLWASADHVERRAPDNYEQGLRALDSSAAAYERTCRSTRTRRCAVMIKLTGTALGNLWRSTLTNPSTRAWTTVPWPQLCASCASRDEGETRIDSVLALGLFDFDWAREEREGKRHSTTPGTNLTYRDVAINHARVIARLHVRDDGSTIQGVRTNRLDGRVISNERHLGFSADSTWARGQAAAIYGFARAGHAFGAADLVQVAERAAGFLNRALPPSGVPPYDFDAPPEAPDDTAAGALGAAALLRLAQACDALSGTCSEGAERWRALGRAMLDAVLARVNPHAPMGVLGDQAYAVGGGARWDDRGEFVFGIRYALEAIALSRE